MQGIRITCFKQKVLSLVSVQYVFPTDTKSRSNVSLLPSKSPSLNVSEDSMFFVSSMDSAGPLASLPMHLRYHSSTVSSGRRSPSKGHVSPCHLNLSFQASVYKAPCWWLWRLRPKGKTMVLIVHREEFSGALRDKNNRKSGSALHGYHCALSLLTSQLSACAAPTGQGAHPLSHSHTNDPGLVSTPQVRALSYKTALDTGAGPTFPQLLNSF